MSSEYTHKDFVDILDILYIKLLRLRSSWDFMSIFVLSGNMDNQFPDLTYSLKYSFGVDAYTTIDAILSSGKYTFFSLKKMNEEFEKEVQAAKNKIKEIIPSIEWNRDKLFCHFVEKQSEYEINDMVIHFPQVFDILAVLHNKAMGIFKVDDCEIRVMPEEKFVKLQEEKTEFSRLLMDALLDNDIRKILKRRYHSCGME